MLFQVHGLVTQLSEMANAVDSEAFMKCIKPVSVLQIPTNRNVIESHVFYRIKCNDDRTKYCKARIDPHGNEDLDL